jgi:polyhydroxyalkanoate synthesis regulator protein
MQVIFEEEKKIEQNLLQLSFLRQLIRFCGDSMQVLVSRYLELSIEPLTRNRDSLRRCSSQPFAAATLELVDMESPDILRCDLEGNQGHRD